MTVIYHVHNGTDFYVGIYGSTSYPEGVKKISVSEEGVAEERIDVYYEKRISVQAYQDRIIYVAKGGKIKSISYDGVVSEIADNATKEEGYSGGLFSSGKWWKEPVKFLRAGNYIYYYQEGKEEKLTKASISSPGEFEYILLPDINQQIENIQEFNKHPKVTIS